jgi:hypothetical protein
MQSPYRSIFRAEAVRRYMQSRERVVLPRFIAPRILFGLWVLLGLLAAAGAGIWFVRVPVYISGSAVVVAEEGPAPGSPAGVMAIVFLPPEAHARLHAGQALFLTFDSAGQPLERSIAAVDPDISSPASVQQRFALGPGAASAVSGPSAVVTARLAPLPMGMSALAYVGSTGRADVQVGSRRIGSLLPLVGRFFGE